MWFSNIPTALCTGQITIIVIIIHRVKRIIEHGLGDEPEDSFTEELQEPSNFKETLQSLSGWAGLESTQPPPLSLQDIHHFFVTKHLKRDEVTASKPFEKGYRIYHAKKVTNVTMHPVNDDSTYSIVRALVKASQRDQFYTSSVAIRKCDGEIIYGYCTCIAGKCSSCNHVAALLFYVDEHNRTATTQRPSCTSLPCQWKKPSKAITQLDIVKPKLGQTTKKSVHADPVDRFRGYVSIERVMGLRRDLAESNAGTLGFFQVWPETTDIRQKAQLANQFSRWHAVHDEAEESFN